MSTCTHSVQSHREPVSHDEAQRIIFDEMRDRRWSRLLGFLVTVPCLMPWMPVRRRGGGPAVLVVRVGVA